MIDSQLSSNKYLLIFLAEVFVYSLFVFFVYSKTTGRSSRQLKTAIHFGIAHGVCFQLFFEFLFAAAWFMRTYELHILTINTLIADFLALIPTFITIDAIAVMPIIILSTISSYGNYDSLGDYLLHPQFEYRDYKRSPFFKLLSKIIQSVKNHSRNF
jgi:hypothetical protein